MHARTHAHTHTHTHTHTHLCIAVYQRTGIVPLLFFRPRTVEGISHNLIVRHLTSIVPAFEDHCFLCTMSENVLGHTVIQTHTHTHTHTFFYSLTSISVYCKSFSSLFYLPICNSQCLNFDMEQEGMKTQLIQLNTLLQVIEPKFYSYLRKSSLDMFRLNRTYITAGCKMCSFIP